MKKYLTLAVALCVILSSIGCYAAVSLNINADGTQTLTTESNTQTALFSDTETTDWYYPHMKTLVGKGGINGYADGAFKPNDTITNAEFIKIVVGIIDGEKQIGTAHWAENYINKAVELGIVLTDEYTAEQYDESIKRQNMAKVVSRTMDKIFHEAIIENTHEYTSRITDWDNTCGVCKPDIAQAYAKGIIAGMPDGSFAGRSSSTRAEAATMIVRLIDEGYRVTMYGNVSFNKTTDVTEDGRMTAAKSKNFMDITLENLTFYKENGKYYVSCTFPELPEGFENWLTIDIERNNEKSVISFTSGFTMIDKQKLSNIGSFRKEIDIDSINEINFIHIKIGVEASKNEKTNSRSCYYNILSSKDNEVTYIKQDGTQNETITFDFGNLFIW